MCLLGKGERQAALNKTHRGCGLAASEEGVEAIKVRAPVSVLITTFALPAV